MKVIKLLLKTDEVKKNLKINYKNIEDQIEDIVNLEVTLSVHAKRAGIESYEKMTLFEADTRASIGRALVDSSKNCSTKAHR